MAGRLGAVILATIVAVGCGEDESGDEAACPSAGCPPLGDDGSGSVGDDAGSSTEAPATDDAPGTTAVQTSGAPGDTTAGGGGAIACDPGSAMFTAAEPPAMERASIQIDPVAMTCAAQGTAGDAPQIVLEVRQTGMVDAVTYGIEVTDSTLGVVFTDPSEGDAQVTQLPADLPITITGTLVDGGAPITVDFEIFSTGPTVIDVAVEFG
jgi:hypothetical protein